MLTQLPMIAKAIKERLLQLASADQLPQNANEFDERLLLPALTGLTYTVSSLTVLFTKKTVRSEYEIILERAHDAFVHLREIRSHQFEMGLVIEDMGNYMFKVVNEKGYTLFTIAPKQSQVNLINNQN